MSSSLETAFLEAIQNRYPNIAAVAQREWRFHPTRRWRFDLAWPAEMVAVEIEGIYGKSSRHRTATGYHADCEKYNAAGEGGWRVLRYTSRHIHGDVAACVDQVARILGVFSPDSAPEPEPEK